MTGGVSSECGDREIPGIYARVDHPEILDFIKHVANPDKSAIGERKFEKLYLFNPTNYFFGWLAT